MADYLMPGYQEISIDEQRSIFSIRNRMIELSANFPTNKIKEICQCGEEERMEHIIQL